MNRYLLITKEGPVASILAVSYDEANDVAIADHGPFGWALQAYDKPRGPFAPADRPRDADGIWCELKRDWRIREVIDLGHGYYRWRVLGQNMGCPPGGYGFDFSWDVPSINDPRYDFDHATRHVMGPWRVRVRVAATAWSSEHERVVTVRAYSERSAGWMVGDQIHSEVTVLEAVPLGALAAAA